MAEQPPCQVEAEPSSKKPQKRRRTNASAKSGAKSGLVKETPTNAQPRLRGLRGRLKGLFDMPVDIMHEVLEHLEPLDLLMLSRTTKPLRKLLLTRTQDAERLWRRCRANIPNLPPIPKDLSEAQYASLMFEPICHFCGTHNVFYIVVLARLRSCRKCGLNQFKRASHHWSGWIPELLNITPQTDDSENGPEWMKGSTRYLESAHESLKAEYLQLPLHPEPESLEHSSHLEHTSSHDTDKSNESNRPILTRQTWLARKQDQFDSLCENASLYTEFVENEIDRKGEEADKVKKKRTAEIVKRMKSLPWQPRLSKQDISVIYEHPDVCVPRPLTDRVWTRLHPLLTSLITAARDRRSGGDLAFEMWTPEEYYDVGSGCQGGTTAREGGYYK